MILLALLLAQSGGPALDLAPRLNPTQPRLGDLLELAWPGSRLRSVEAFGCRYAALGNVALIAIPTDTSTGAHTLLLQVPEGVKRVGFRVRPREVKVTELSVDRKFTGRRSPELQARLDGEAERIQRMWRAPPRAEGAPEILGAAFRPVPGRVSSRFGNQRRFNGKLKSEHYGLDLRGRTGTRIRAPLSGVVALSEDRWGSGGTVYLDHGAGLLTGYFHLSERGVEAGDRVQAGQEIGAVGATGRVTGPHLHWAAALRCQKPDGGYRGMYVDPEPLLRDGGAQLR
ncbi:MAG: M23 family metallopeptidase [Myxococcota bacterium]